MSKEFACIASMKNSYSSNTKTNLLTNKVIIISVIELHEDLSETCREGGFRFVAVQRVVVTEHLVSVKRRRFTTMC